MAVCVFVGDALAKYGFGQGHPFDPQRLGDFWNELVRQGLDKQLAICVPVLAQPTQIEQFHTQDYVAFVKAKSKIGTGFLDEGDTPAFPGIYEAAATVVGTTLDALHRVMNSDCRRAFVPIAGLHHARKDSAAGFCVFNDCGVAIEVLKIRYQLKRIAYVDIDAHHGDGVFYSFENDPDVFIADLHEDGRYLYPGTGGETETGTGLAKGTKLNIPMPPNADDGDFMQAWDQVEKFLHEIILFQCGADSLAGDPLTHLKYSFKAHEHAAKSLCQLANEYCGGRVLAMGGGGYNHANIISAWMAVVKALLSS